MKLIGITGKTGAGKTTMSNILAEHEDVVVIHIDELVDELKLKYFKLLMKKDVYGRKVKIDPKLKKIILQNKFLLELAMKLRAKLLKKPLELRIKELEKVGKQTILIDDWFLKYLSIYKDLSFIILMERPFIDRSNSVMKRDKVDKEEIVIGDLGQKTGDYNTFLNESNLIRIENNQGKAELREKCEILYEDHMNTKKESISKKNKWKVEKEKLSPINISKKTNEREKDKGDEEYGE